MKNQNKTFKKILLTSRKKDNNKIKDRKFLNFKKNTKIILKNKLNNVEFFKSKIKKNQIKKIKNNKVKNNLALNFFNSKIKIENKNFKNKKIKHQKTLNLWQKIAKNMQKSIVFLLILGLFFTVGCTNKLKQTLQENISEVRYNLFIAKNDEIMVKFTSGFREDPYVIDGISNNKKEFGVITVKFFKEISNKPTSPNFVITIESMDYDGEFELNPFDQTYVQDIETFVLDDTTISIKICFGDFVFEGNLKNISKDFSINHKDALNLFSKEFKKDIQTLLKNKNSFEVYIKILSDPSLNIDTHYFYVCLISNNNDTFSCIIDPFLGTILAKNQNKNQIIL